MVKTREQIKTFLNSGETIILSESESESESDLESVFDLSIFFDAEEPSISVMENLQLRLPDPLKLDGNVAENWRVFKQNFDVFAIAKELDEKAEPVKIATFLNACGPEAIETFNTFELTDDQKKSYDEVVKAFKGYCEPKKNEAYEAFKFNSRNQAEGETFDNFLLDLKKLVKNCGYTDKNRMIRDRIVSGISDERLRRKLLETSDLTMDKSIEMARTSELTKKHANEMQKHATTHTSVDAVGRQSNQRNKQSARSGNVNKDKKFGESNNAQNKINCKFCKSMHIYGRCPAFGKKCNNCGRMNHFSVACATRKYAK